MIDHKTRLETAGLELRLGLEKICNQVHFQLSLCTFAAFYLGPSSYRPISNLTVISKLLERLVARQLVAYMYLDNHHLLPTTQS